MRLHKTYLFVCLYFSLTSTMMANDNIKLHCNEPKGMRVEYGSLSNLSGEPIKNLSDPPEWSEDGYTNMYPTFEWSNSSAEIIKYSWGSTQPEDMVGIIDQQIREEQAIVVYKDDNIIEAASVSCGSATCRSILISLYPKLKYVTRTDHWYATLFNPSEGFAAAATYQMQCRSSEG